MSGAHTQGPWKVSADEPMRIFSERTGCYVANTYQRDNTDSYANARLIAAAPELLWFAEQVLMGITSGMIRLETPAEETLERVIKAGYAAIAKATRKDAA